jgi:hypothetical protein
MASSDPPPKARAKQQNSSKVTPDQAVLTAKNYRMAKELSELRVRHREECKNVTRLTMENMNLASRCREAISHVAMLKKELALTQKQTGSVLTRKELEHSQNTGTSASVSTVECNDTNVPEVLVPTRQPEVHQLAPLSTSQSVAGPTVTAKANSVSRKSDEGVKKDTPGRLCPIHEPPSKSTKESGTGASPTLTLTANSTDESSETESTLTKNDGMQLVNSSEGSTVSPRQNLTPPSPAVLSEDAESEVEDSPDSHDIPIGTADSDEFEEQLSGMDEDTLSSGVPSPTRSTRSEKRDYFDESKETKEDGVKSSYTHTTPTKFGRGAYNESFPEDITSVRKSHSRSGILELISDQEESASSSITSNASQTPHAKADQSTISSIDAFEASFSTNFPASFSPKDDDALPVSSPSRTKSDYYNPFFPTPPKAEASESKRIVETESTLVSSGQAVPYVTESEVHEPHDISTPLLPTSWISPVRSIRSRAVMAVSRLGGSKDTAEISGQDRTSYVPVGSAKTISPAESPVPSKQTTSPLIARLGQRFSPQRHTEERTLPELLGRLRTPPPLSTGNEISPTDSLSGARNLKEPPRPEKRGYIEARARYEKALAVQKKEIEENRLAKDDQPQRNHSIPANGRSSHVIQSDVRVRDRVADLSPESRSAERTRADKWRNESSVAARTRSPVYPYGEEEGDIPLHTRICSPANTSSQKIVDLPSPASTRRSRGGFVDSSGPSALPSSSLSSDGIAPINVPAVSSLSRFPIRRSISQPSSYAEPSVQTKLRRGDVYFPKEGARN